MKHFSSIYLFDGVITNKYLIIYNSRILHMLTKYDIIFNCREFLFVLKSMRLFPIFTWTSSRLIMLSNNLSKWYKILGIPKSLLVEILTYVIHKLSFFFFGFIVTKENIKEQRWKLIRHLIKQLNIYNGLIFYFYDFVSILFFLMIN